MGIQDREYMELGYRSVAEAMPAERIQFIKRTYMTLLGSIIAFIAIEAVVLQTAFAESFTVWAFSGRMNWLIVLGAWMFVSWIAERAAIRSTSLASQYGWLGVFIAAEAVIFIPLLLLAKNHYPNAIRDAGVTTLLVFGGLTLTVFFTKKDFSFLGPAISVASLAAIALIVFGMISGFHMGTFLPIFIVVIMCGSILYQTSNIMRTYQTTQYVASALALFATVATMFWYILQLFMSADD